MMSVMTANLTSVSERMCWRAYFAAIICLSCCIYSAELSSQDRYFRLHLAAGIIENAHLDDLQEPLGFSFWSRTQSQTLPAKAIARWGAWQPPQQSSVLWLADGSWIVGRPLFSEKTVKLEDNDWLNTLSVPLALCRGLVVSAPVRALDWHRLQSQMESATGETDHVWMQDGRKLQGILTALSMSPSDSAVDQAATRVIFNSSGRKFELELESEIQAIVFSPALQQKMVARQQGAALALRDGSLLHINRVTRLQTGKLKLHLEVPIEVASRDEVTSFATAVDYVAGVPESTTWLSDLEPELYRHLPTTSLRWKLGRDKDLFGRPLSIADSFVEKGLAMHSPSQCAYGWDLSPGKFLSEIIMAAPPEATPADLGSVQCKVMLIRDGKLVEAFKSPILRSRDLPLPVEADISGAQTVVLITDQADTGSLGDHVLWLDARFVRVPQSN